MLEYFDFSYREFGLPMIYLVSRGKVYLMKMIWKFLSHSIYRKSYTQPLEAENDKRM